MLRKIFKLLTSRLVFFGFLLLIQLIWLLTFLTRLTTYSTAISVLFTLVSLLAVLWIVRRGENPAYQMAWVIFILVFPLLGGLFYLLVGNKQPSKNMRRRLETEQSRTREALAQEGQLPQAAELIHKAAELADVGIYANPNLKARALLLMGQLAEGLVGYYRKMAGK